MKVLEELQTHRERKNSGGKMFAGIKQSASGFPLPPEPYKNAALVDGRLVVTGKDPLPDNIKNAHYDSLEEAIDHLHRGVEPDNVASLKYQLVELQSRIEQLEAARKA